MAVKLLTTSDGLASPTAANWRTAGDAFFNVDTSVSNDDAFNAAAGRTIAVTYGASGSNSAIGVVLWLYRIKTLTGTPTFTVTLQHFTGGVWTDTAGTVTANISTLPSYWDGHYITHSAVTINQNASEWRYKVVSSASGQLNLCRTSTAGAYFYAAILNDNGGPTSTTDSLLIGNGQTLTFDANYTAAVKDGYSIAICSTGVLACATSPAANITLTTSNKPILHGTSASIIFGSSGTKVATAHKVIVDIGTAINVFDNAYSLVLDNPGTPTANTFYQTQMEFWGTEDTHLVTYIASRSSANSTTISTTEDMSALWSNGDVLYIVGKDTSPSSYNTTTHTISSISGTTITLTTGIGASVTALKGAAVVNKTRGEALPIQFTTSSSGHSFARSGTSSSRYISLVLTGVYLHNILFASGSQEIWNTTGSTPYTLRSVYVDGLGNGFYLHDPIRLDFDISNIHFIGTTNNTGINIGSSQIIPTVKGTISKLTAMNCYGANSSFANWYINSVTCDHIVMAYSAASTNISNPAGQIFGFNNTLTSCAFLSTISFNVSGSSNTFTSCEFQNNVYNLVLVSGVNNKFISCNIGNVLTATTQDLFCNTALAGGYTLTNCNLGSKGVNNATAMLDKSFVRFHNYNASAGDHRSWIRQGTYVSSSSRLKETNASITETVQTIYNGSLADMTSTKLAASVNCQINSSTYYSGTNTLPKLTVGYDSTTSVATASASTSLQSLLAIFSPSNNNAPFSITLSTKTDQASQDVYFDNLTVVARRYGKIFGSITKVITEATDDIVFDILTPATNTHITQATAATVAAYTGISINHSTQTVTLTSNHSIQELYDYTQYDLTLDANMGKAEWFTTIDDVTYTSTYNVTVNGCVLSGSGKNLNLGSMTFTLTGGGTTTAKVTDVSGSLVALVVNNVVASSQCYIENSSSHAVYMNTTPTAGVASANFLWTIDVAVTVRVRLNGYQEWTTTGTITNNGLTLTAGQATDGTY